MGLFGTISNRDSRFTCCSCHPDLFTMTYKNSRPLGQSHIDFGIYRPLVILTAFHPQLGLVSSRHYGVPHKRIVLSSISKQDCTSLLATQLHLSPEFSISLNSFTNNDTCCNTRQSSRVGQSQKLYRRNRVIRRRVASGLRIFTFLCRRCLAAVARWKHSLIKFDRVLFGSLRHARMTESTGASISLRLLALSQKCLAFALFIIY